MIFEELQDKILLSKINLAYVNFVQGDKSSAKLILNKIVRKEQGEKDDVSFIHLAIGHPAITNTDRIVEDVTIPNIAAWNSALISSQLGEDVQVQNSFLKKISKKGNEGLIHRRVENWIIYYRGQVREALEGSQKLQKEIKTDDYLLRAVQKDIEVFKSELETTK